MSHHGKPLPVPDIDSAPFWEGCRNHRLVIQRCTDCGQLRFPPTGMCPHCRSVNSEWITASGRGRLYSWIVVRHPVPREIYASDVPYVVALVDLEEGVRISTNMTCPPDELMSDMPVEVLFDDVSPELTLPKFRPVR
ncbi:MAG: OB-fold domain-containing protein [Pseudorhodoplanes sp.]|nr:OB-fold domain-containing protein [Pseudorhodoplanes sp.]